MFDLNKNEEEVLKYWSENGILEKTRAKNKGKKPFYFLDGPLTPPASFILVKSG